jgi:hypothetical protein
MKMAVMKLGNTPRPGAWSPLASFPPPVLLLATSIQLSPSSCGSGRIVGSMWRPTEAEVINRRTPRAKGAPNWARSGLGRSPRPAGPGLF